MGRGGEGSGGGSGVRESGVEMGGEGSGGRGRVGGVEGGTFTYYLGTHIKAWILKPPF